MKQAFKKLLTVFLLYTLLSVVQRIVFVCLYATSDVGAGQWLSAFAHGLPLDLSIAGYLSAIPALLIVASLAGGGRWVSVAEKIYYGITSVALSGVYVLDLVLYSYWHSRIDFSPLFYFSTSPASALASATAWQLILGLIAWLAVAAAFFFIFLRLVATIKVSSQHRLRDVALMLLVTACLFIPIRGSFTVAPVNLSQAYFCSNQRVNHAAVNPAFSLFYSVTHQENFDRQFRFMDDSEAETVHNRLYSTIPTDSVASPLLKADYRPDIYVILLESFSNALFPSLGGENVASGLDSIAKEGLTFSNIYASGFRTDRAIPAVISGFPAQPTVSVMKYVEKAAKLPALPRELAKLGYESLYFYGGDAAFTNMKAFLINTGFSDIVSDRDFDISDRLSKWGAPDHLVFRRALQDISKPSGSPRFVMIQTSSSHEPFDVPYSNPAFSDKRLNAFAYVDSCATDFVNQLTAKGLADNALIVFVADHYGVWPEDATGLDRFHIPLIMTGGALARRGETITEAGSQTDIAATILDALALDSQAFEFSRNLLDPTRRPFAVFAGNGTYGFLNETDTLIYECNSGNVILHGGDNPHEADEALKGSLQYLYHKISEL